MGASQLDLAKKDKRMPHLSCTVDAASKRKERLVDFFRYRYYELTRFTFNLVYSINVAYLDRH